jgi:hypothetical protein
MFITDLFEDNSVKHASFCFGRMNPPTVGHAQLINTVAKASQGGDYFVFVSQSQDSKKNPLDYATKIKFLRALFPDQAGHIVSEPTVKTIMDVIHWLYAKGYRSITMIAGSDRLGSFQELLPKYNGVEGVNGAYYKFDNINFVSSGERDPDAEGIAGVSASSAREAAKAGNLEAFAQATGAGKLAEPLYNAVRKGMLLADPELAESVPAHAPTGKEWDRLPEWKKEWYRNWTGGLCKHPQPYHEPRWWDPDRPMSECSGYIPKNKKEAKDPRWSNALTVDVTTQTPKTPKL